MLWNGTLGIKVYCVYARMWFSFITTFISEKTGLRFLYCSDCELESRWGQRCWSVVYAAASATSWSLVQRSPTGCVCVCVCDLGIWTITRSRPYWAVAPSKNCVELHIIRSLLWVTQKVLRGQYSLNVQTRLYIQVRHVTFEMKKYWIILIPVRCIL